LRRASDIRLEPFGLNLLDFGIPTMTAVASAEALIEEMVAPRSVPACRWVIEAALSKLASRHGCRAPRPPISATRRSTPDAQLEERFRGRSAASPSTLFSDQVALSSLRASASADQLASAFRHRLDGSWRRRSGGDDRDAAGREARSRRAAIVSNFSGHELTQLICALRLLGRDAVPSGSKASVFHSRRDDAAGGRHSTPERTHDSISGCHRRRSAGAVLGDNIGFWFGGVRHTSCGALSVATSISTSAR